MKKAYLKYLLALLMFGSNGIVASHIALSSYEIVFLRTIFGSGLLIAVFFLTKRGFGFLRRKKELGLLLLSGIAMGASWMFLYEAYRQIGVSMASLAYYCGPVIVMALSPLLFHERLTAPKVFGFLLVLGGISLVNLQAPGGESTGWGLFCGAMSAVTYALMVIFNKKAGSAFGIENPMLQLISAFFIVAAFIGIKQGFALSVASTDWVPILILGLLNTGVGCYFYFSSIGSLPVQTVAISGYLEPLSALIFSALILRERLSALQVLGAVLILGGAIIGERMSLKKKSA